MSSGVGSVVPKQNPPTTSAGHESIVSRSDLPVVGVDLGGTKIAAGLVDDDGGMRRHRVVETPVSSADAVITAIESLVREVTEGRRSRAVGVGAPGMISADRSRVVYAPNLPLTDVDLGRALARRLGVPVTVENDANAAAWAETRFGAGKGASSAVVLTVGTGIGGGIVFNGQLLRGSFGAAAEIGHLLLCDTGPRCGCGSTGCFEALASGSALVREARSRARAQPEQAIHLLELADGDPRAVTGALVTAAAEKGDPASLASFQVIGYWLGRGIASLVALLDVETVVLGGGVSRAGELVLRPARDGAHSLMIGREVRPVPNIVLAQLQSLAGVVGAADLARAVHIAAA